MSHINVCVDVKKKKKKGEINFMELLLIIAKRMNEERN